MAGKATRTPARDRVRPFVAQAMAEGWSASKLSREAKVSRNVAASVLKDASIQTVQELEADLSKQGNIGLRVAQRVRDEQTAQGERMNALATIILENLEKKAMNDPDSLSVKDLSELVRLRSQHWQHQKDLAGITVAEKIAIGQAKGDAQGAAIGSALIDATAIEIGEQVWMDTEPEEAELIAD